MKIVTNLLVVCSLAVAPLAMAQTINQWKDPKTGNTIFPTSLHHREPTWSNGADPAGYQRAAILCNTHGG